MIAEHEERRTNAVRLSSMIATGSGRHLAYGHRTAAEPRGDDWEPHDGDDVVVCCDPVMSLEAAAEAAVHEHLFALGSREDGDWRHARAAIARPVARDAAIDMQRVEAVGAMIAVAPTVLRLAREYAALTASEPITPLRYPAACAPGCRPEIRAISVCS
jgi:hypothetical protein